MSATSGPNCGPRARKPDRPGRRGLGELKQDLAFIGWILIVGILIPALYIVAMVTRHSAIRRPGGAVECSFRQDGDDRWRRGVAAYRTDQLCWFRSNGMRLRPDAAFDRHALQLVARHDADSAVDQTVVVRFETGAGGQPIWLAMSRDALTGLLAWLEASPQYWFGSC
jgi:hypothetical protein